MTQISNKQKECISNIYLMCIVSTDIRTKLSVLNNLHSAIRAALLSGKIIKIISTTTQSGNDITTLESEKEDRFNSAQLLNESKKLLYEAYTTYATRNNWIGAEQKIIEITERLTALGYMHEFIDVEPERWNASYSFLAPSGAADGE